MSRRVLTFGDFVTCPDYLDRVLTIFNTLNTGGILHSFRDDATHWSDAALDRMQLRCEQSRLRTLDLSLGDDDKHAVLAV